LKPVSRIILLILFLFLFILNIFLIIAGYQMVYSYNEEIKNNRIKSRLTQITTGIIYLDEINMMSIVNAIKTKNSKWEKKFNTYNPQQEALINELLKLPSNDEIFQVAKQLKFTDQKLYEFESESFKLVKKGFSKQAEDLISSREYEVLRSFFSQKVQKVIELSKIKDKENFFEAKDLNSFFYQTVILSVIFTISFLISIKLIIFIIKRKN